MAIVNGYYHIKFIEFIEAGREDLVTRLGLMAYWFGDLFYPVSFILIAFIIWFFSAIKWSDFLIKTGASTAGLFLVRFALYDNCYVAKILFGPKEKWLAGLVFCAVSILMISKKT